WSVPATRQTVSRLDSLLIGQGAEVVLVDGSNDNVYTCEAGQKDNIRERGIDGNIGSSFFAHKS
ncbi:MAG: hypothetical protein II110_06660, partial [Treponema sp.]|nr:hypothetical protein [Treponema sp.]